MFCRILSSSIMHSLPLTFRAICGMETWLGGFALQALNGSEGEGLRYTGAQSKHSILPCPCRNATAAKQMLYHWTAVLFLYICIHGTFSGGRQTVFQGRLSTITVFRYRGYWDSNTLFSAKSGVWRWLTVLPAAPFSISMSNTGCLVLFFLKCLFFTERFLFVCLPPWLLTWLVYTVSTKWKMKQKKTLIFKPVLIISD